MASPISIKINIQPWVKKYLISISQNKCEPLEFSRKHEYNRLLINLISNRYDIVNEKIFKENSVKIKLRYNQIKNVDFYNKIARNSAIEFRKQIKSDIMFAFYIFTKDKLLSGEQRKEAIIKFFKIHNISEDDLKLESFYRKFTRYIEKCKLIYSFTNTTS